MRELVPDLRAMLDSGRPFALATTVAVQGSSPRPAGSVLAVDAAGRVAGSLSGGCVEGAVYAAAQEVLAGHPVMVERYGISSEDAFAVGLTCGGVLDVLVQRIEGAAAQALRGLLDHLQAEEPVALATVVSGPAARGARLVLTPDAATGGLGSTGLDVAVSADARGLLAGGQDATLRYGAHGERRVDDVAVFIQSFTPPPRMLVFGAIDFAAAVARLGVYLGYRVTVCDARAVFATQARFPDAHEVVVAWPHDYLAGTAVDERTVICVLTHDPKFDVPLLELALRGPAAYVGAMGSRRTHDDRLEALQLLGLSGPELSRLHSPIGLDLGARTPEETAVSIAAEIVRARWGGSGRPLRDTDGAIHRAPADAELTPAPA